MSVRAPLTVTCVAVLTSVLFAYEFRPWEMSCYARNQCDAVTFSIAGDLLQEGRSPYDASARVATAERRLGAPPPFDLAFQYPPHVLPLFSVIGWLCRSEAGLLLWVGFSVAMFAASLSTIMGERGASVALAFAFSGVAALNAFLGQTGALVGALGIGITGLWTSRPGLAGLLLATLTMKPQYALVVGLVAIVHRDWRVLGGAVAGCAALAVLSVLLYGTEPWLTYREAIQADNVGGSFMVSWVGPLVSAGVSISPVTALAGYVCSLPVLGWVIHRLTRWHLTAESLVGVALTCALAVSPHTHPYDLTLLAPALVTLTERRSSVPWMFLALSWMGIMPAMRWLLFAGVVAVLVQQFRAASDAGRSMPLRGAETT